MIGAWRGMGARWVASPILHKGQRRLTLQHRTGASEGSKPRNVGAVGAPTQ
jgi:hypothetical protein